MYKYLVSILFDANEDFSQRLESLYCYQNDILYKKQEKRAQIRTLLLISLCLRMY